MSARLPLLAWLRAATLLLGAALGLGAEGAGSLVVAPTRVLLEGRARSAEVLLHNGGDAPATYRISLVNQVMAEDGQSREAAGSAPASAMLRFSPRQVRLAAGASQAVRIQWRKPETLADGEYRAHLLFQAVQAGDPAAPVKAAAAGLSMSIRAVYGVSIPVLLRQGQPSATCALANPALIEPEQGSRLQVAVDLLRQGGASVYGDLLATWEPRGGKAAPVARLNGVAVYSELACRKLRLRLELARQPGPGRLKLAYLQHGTAKALAETSLELP